MTLQNTLRRAAQISWLGVALCAVSTPAQSNANAPAAVPAGDEPSGSSTTMKVDHRVSAKDARAADDAYIEGARHIQRGDYEAAEKSFGRALSLNPQNADYLRAFAFAQEGRVSSLVHAATVSRQAGMPAEADALLQQARKIDPDNSIISEHLANGGDIQSATFDPLRFPAANIGSTLAGAVELEPDPGKHSVHVRGDTQSALRDLYRTYGLTVQFDDNLPQTKPVRLDLDDVDFATASALLHSMTRTFAVAAQPKAALIAANTEENRNRLQPQLEETIYLRGMGNDQMQDLAKLARDVFDVKIVTASPTGGTILLRTDERTMKLVNATYANMLDGAADVLLDVKVYEVDKSRTRNLGVTFPSSFSVFSVASELQNALNANQTALNTAESSGLISQGALTANQFKLVELYYLYQAGLLSTTQSSEITSLLGLGYIGTIGGLPLAGITIGSGASVSAMLQSSDARMLDAITLRASDTQKASFRDGERYPIETSSYTTGGSSALSSALAGASSAVRQAAAAYLGSTTSVTIPQISFEDLGLLLEATPTVQRNREIKLNLHFKIEALGSGSLNGIPELNNREFTSVATVPSGQTVMLASAINTNEVRAIQGFPGLNELPGFQGTQNDSQLSSQELLITITPHLVRDADWHVTSRRVLMAGSSPPQ